MLTLSGTCIGYGLWIFAGSFWILVLSRTIGGIASGNLSVATAAIADVTSEKKDLSGMAIVGIAFGLGFVLGSCSSVDLPVLGIGQITRIIFLT